MVRFTCDSCGKCCSSFGSFITIERQLNDRDYYCRYSLTRDLFPVHVSRECADEVSDRFSAFSGTTASPGKRPCPFLCSKPGGAGYTCSIYDNRPQICREFRCYRMLVYDRNNRLIGKVIGAGEISTSDETLARLWKQEIASVPHSHPPGGNDLSWVKKSLQSSRHTRSAGMQWNDVLIRMRYFDAVAVTAEVVAVVALVAAAVVAAVVGAV